MPRSTFTSILVLALIQVAMCAVAPDPITFFSKINGNLTKIVWAHAVNNQILLSKALSSSDIMMLEADVSIGNITGSSKNLSLIPIMAHPPDSESDLSLEEFLNKTHNGTKGIKLDFKSIDAFESSRPIIEKFRTKIGVPVFLNADILPGPINATNTPLNAKTFLKGAKVSFPESIISAGWTTSLGKEPNSTDSRYSGEQLKKMVEVLKENNITQSVTYPVRAGFAANDAEGIKSLFKDTTGFKNVTLTIWSHEKDPVDTDKLSRLIKDVGVGRVYIDVPQDVMNKLNISGALQVTSAFSLIAMAVTLCLARIF
ncbi:protein FAM151B [Prorops nasuta]|uniref:protein FAM151B n=1 Tax=Prorops nasuta TaxID=863751 RepID=UPI0034CE2927